MGETDLTFTLKIGDQVIKTLCFTVYVGEVPALIAVKPRSSCCYAESEAECETQEE